MYLGLSGKVALVTGSSRGIGKAIAQALAQEGSSVVLTARGAQGLSEAVSDIKNLGSVPGKVYAYPADVADRHEIKSIFDGVILKRLDILVNNVGGPLKFGRFFDLTDEDWWSDWDFNFMSMVRFTREAIPWLKKSGNGRIINISSVPARQPGEFNPHYAASKAAMLNLSKYLANILAKDNILVNSICPNTIEGGLWGANVTDRARRDNISEAMAAERIRASALKKMPLQRMGTPEDVAHLAAFLASDKAKHITGAVFNVDGGTVRSVT